MRYLVDYELDADISYFKGDYDFVVDFIRRQYDQKGDSNALNKAMAEARSKSCFQLKFYDYLPDIRRLTTAQSHHRSVLERSNGAIFLKNVEIQVTVDGHHGQFTTRESTT